MKPLPWAKVKRLARRQTEHPLQQYRDCPLCESDASEELLSFADFQFFTDHNGQNRADHQIVACNACGLLYTNPCYTHAGFQVLFEKAGYSYGHSEPRIREQVEWLDQHFPDMNSLMDIGCGSGDLLSALPDQMALYGIDVDEHTLNKAAQHLPGVSFSACDFDGLKSLPQVDVITLFHVLEHIADPVAFLKCLRQLSKKSVSLVIEVPVVDRATAEQDRDIVGFFTIQHLTHFSQCSLENMLTLCGWQLVYSEAVPGYNGWRVVAKQGEANQSACGKDERSLSAAQSYLSVWNENVARARRRIEAVAEADEIMIWGVGQHTEYLVLLTRLFELNARFVMVDSDPLKQGQTYHSLPVLAPSQVPENAWAQGTFPIVISTYGGQESIQMLLESKGVSPDRIITLYDRTLRY